MLLRPSQSGTSSLKLYQDCRLSLEAFQDALFDHDYSGLIIEGRPTKRQLQDAWGKIYLNYCELSDTAQSPMVEKIKQVQYLNARVELGRGIASHLEQVYDAELVAMISQLGVPGVNCAPGDDRKPTVKLMLAYVKRWATDRDVAQKELDELQSENGAKIGREYFDDWLEALSAARRYAVRAVDITVAQFVRATKKLSEQYSKPK
jgi:hypothetical protein